MHVRSILPALLFAACSAPNPRPVQADGVVKAQAPGALTPSHGVDVPDPDSGPSSQETFEASGEFTLATAMDLARSNAIQVLRAADAHLEATADLRLAQTDTYYPHLTAGAGVGRVSGRVQSTEGLFPDVDNENATIGISVSFDVDLAAATHGLESVREALRASSWDWIAAELAAETAAALFYHDLLEASARVEIAEAAVDSASAYHALAEARFQAGAGLEADVLRAFAHLAEARQRHIEALATGGITSTRIAELLGLDPMRPLEPTDALEPHDLVEDVGEIDLSTHPILEASRARLAAAEANMTAQRSSWYLPELLLDVGFNDFGEEFGELEGQEGITAAISWDLSPSVFASADRARAELLSARHDVEADLRRIQSDLVRAQISALASADLLGTTQARVDAARSAVGLERTRHEEGDALLIELLDAEVSLRRAETAHAAAVCTYNRSQHLLRQSLGG